MDRVSLSLSRTWERGRDTGLDSPRGRVVRSAEGVAAAARGAEFARRERHALLPAARRLCRRLGLPARRAGADGLWDDAPQTRRGEIRVARRF